MDVKNNNSDYLITKMTKFLRFELPNLIVKILFTDNVRVVRTPFSVHYDRSESSRPDLA